MAHDEKREAWVGFEEAGKHVWVGPFATFREAATWAPSSTTPRPENACILGPSSSIQWMRDWIGADEIRQPSSTPRTQGTSSP